MHSIYLTIIISISDIRKVGIVLTDGRSDDPDATWEQAMSLRSNRDVSMIAVGVGNNIRQLELESIASAPHSSTVMLVEDFDDLDDDAEENLLNAVCNSK